MKLFLPCILLVSASTLSAAVDFQLVSGPAARSVFMRRPSGAVEAARIAKRSLPAWLSQVETTRIRRRRSIIEEDDSCKALQGADTRLSGNTHQVSYRPRSCYCSPFSRLTTSRDGGASRCTERPDQLSLFSHHGPCFSLHDHCGVF